MGDEFGRFRRWIFGALPRWEAAPRNPYGRQGVRNRHPREQQRAAVKRVAARRSQRKRTRLAQQRSRRRGR